MKIGIDARLYGPISKGIGRYLQELISYLEKLDQNNEYVIFLYSKNFDEYQPQNPRFKKVLAPYRWYSLAEQFKMPKLIEKEKIDLMHFPHFNVPLFYKKPFILTIHDLILTKFPSKRASTKGFLTYWLKNLFYKLTIKSALKRAKKIMAVSKHTKDDIVQQFGIKPEKIEVIYLGLTKLPQTGENSNDKKVIIDYNININLPYILYVGNAYPHKNLEKLISTFTKLEDLQLVLVGKIDYFYKRLQSLSEKLGLEKKVLFLGYVPDEKLAVLYKNAKAYIFPSLYEGFGLPPLEAMSFGIPVVSSNASCLPEILEQAALYFKPKNNDEMIEKINQVVTDEDLRQKLINQGFEQIKKYNWSDCSQKTLDIYNQTLENA